MNHVAAEPDVPATTPMPDYSEIPRITVTRSSADVAPGFLFISPQSMFEPAVPHGPQIVDNQGRLVWFRPVPEGQYATNVRVQRYRGEPVITWWQGTATDTGVGVGTAYIADLNYQIIASVQVGGGHSADLHEFLLTDRDTALVVSYQERSVDLSELDGPADGTLIDGVVEEIDVATGEVLLHWSGLEHIPVQESDMPVVMSLATGQPYDYLHLNAVSIDDDGHLLITARISSAVYKVHRQTGEVLWKLGSGYSTFVLGVGARVNWPHDGQAVGDGVYRIFDNGANNMIEGYESRVVWVRADTETGVATHVRTLTHPEHLSSVAEGNAQELPNGNVLVGWGRVGRISEFSPDGELLFEAETPSGPGWTTYRAFRQEWEGRPATPPEVRFDGEHVHAFWNGATGVARWRLLAGDTEDALREADVVDWDGLDTTIKLPEAGRAGFVRLEALDADGKVIDASPVTRVGA
ncbi:hypothetical protein GCM10009678_80090 [Actinomadura kijaniata]|uniref:Arylsulfotransferase n=1 Tax=Actinomadura namibiensis TaxID=182080 RepID=A0A7W3LYU3_ACTNM|nr:arylsulfotransferase family protein [Actinomadura namibiensis]MBA8956754.1 hypothetical protein [Actinomadura namibiensis]